MQKYQITILQYTILIIYILIISGCWDERNKTNYVETWPICNNTLYVETYLVYGGAFAQNVYSNYLTDSTNFRIYVGFHDDSKHFIYKCINDTVYVMVTPIGGGLKNATLLNKYNISYLTQTKEFE